LFITVRQTDSDFSEQSYLEFCDTESCAILGYFIAGSGSFLSTFQDNCPIFQVQKKNILFKGGYNII